MKTSKFKAGDNVRIVSNDLQSQYKGKVGKVKKAYLSFTETQDRYIAMYRVEVNGETLKGLAMDSDLELV